jgi:hypothetical protein
MISIACRIATILMELLKPIARKYIRINMGVTVKGGLKPSRSMNLDCFARWNNMPSYDHKIRPYDHIDGQNGHMIIKANFE